MDRYLATWRGPDGTVHTAAFGRCRDADEAQRLAEHQFKAPSFELMSVRRETWFEAVGFRAGRIVIRTGRILIGAALGLVAYVFLIADHNIADVPFSQMTLGMLFGALFRGGLMVIAAGIAFQIAFGEADDY